MRAAFVQNIRHVRTRILFMHTCCAHWQEEDYEGERGVRRIGFLLVRSSQARAEPTEKQVQYPDLQISSFPHILLAVRNDEDSREVCNK